RVSPLPDRPIPAGGAMRLDRDLGQSSAALAGHLWWPSRAFVSGPPTSTTSGRTAYTGRQVMQRRARYEMVVPSVLAVVLVLIVAAGPAAAQGKQPIRIG